MQLCHIRVTGFRNIDSLTLEPHSSVNILYGPNGAGKTNILEAIFTLCLGRSQKNAADTTLLKRDAGFYRLEGALETARGKHEVAVAFQKGVGKRVTLDRVPSQLSELYRTFAAVAAGPEDSEILAGSPAVRRWFLDIHLSQLSAAYLADLAAYRQAVQQKNAALRQEMDPEPFHAPLVSHGARVMAARGAFIRSLQKRSGALYHQIAGGERLEVGYRPSVTEAAGTEDTDAIEKLFLQALERAAVRERALQTALVGPHRDDLEFQIDGLPARTHGSQGQWRTAALALKLAVWEVLREHRGDAPLLLLDEVFAELDRDRARRLVATFAHFSQIFLTTAMPPDETLQADARCFTIRAGTVVEVA